MAHDVWLPEEIVELRADARAGVEKSVAPNARAIGATEESAESLPLRLEELYRDAKILEIFEGANELQQWIVARRLIGRDVTG